MPLFHLSRTPTSAPCSFPPAVCIPVGSVAFRLEVLGQDVLRGSKPSCSITATGARHLRWIHPLVHAELLVLDTVEPSLPEGMRLTGAGAGIWRVEIQAAVQRLDFMPRWELLGETTAEPSDSGGGERLLFQSWTAPPWMLAHATEDEDVYYARTGTGRWCPRRFRDRMDINNLPFTAPEVLRDGGLGVGFGPLLPGDRFQIKHVAGWAHESLLPIAAEAMDDEHPCGKRDERLADLELWLWYGIDLDSFRLLLAAGVAEDDLA